MSSNNFIKKGSLIGMIAGLILVALSFLETTRYKIYDILPDIFFRFREAGPLLPAISKNPRIFLIAIVLFIIPILIGALMGYLIKIIRR